MKDLLDSLEQQWLTVSAYRDLKALAWLPGDEVATTCPEGCAVVDSGWHSMLHADGGVDAHRRTVFCRKHSFARIYVITGPMAAEHGWTAPAS